MTGSPSTAMQHVDPEPIATALESMATSTHVAVIVDVDALENSRSARSDDRAMVLVLDGLTHVDIRIGLVHDRSTEQSLGLHQKLRGSWLLRMPPEHAVAETRSRLFDPCIIMVSDQRRFFEALGPSDRGLALGTNVGLGLPANVTAICDLGLRPALWWLVDARIRHRASISPPTESSIAGSS